MPHSSSFLMFCCLASSPLTLSWGSCSHLLFPSPCLSSLLLEMMGNPGFWEEPHAISGLSQNYKPTPLRLSTYPPTHLPTYPPTHLFIHSSIHPPTQSIHPSFHPSTRLFTHPSFSPFLPPSFPPSLPPPTLPPSTKMACPSQLDNNFPQSEHMTQTFPKSPNQSGLGNEIQHETLESPMGPLALSAASR